ncbi:MAG TPA: hypothetical protein VFF29_07210 [Bacteroidota bacterium]|nr:hypothetical protein [Bacteroidota bacterium]
MEKRGIGSLTTIILLSIPLWCTVCKRDEISPITENPPHRIQLSYSHEDSLEAMEFALWLSGKLRPTDSLVSELLYNLNYLRFVYDDSVRYRDSLSVLRWGGFMAPWVVSQLAVKFDSVTAQLVNSGRYDAWDQFEASLRPVYFDSVDILGWTWLKFDGYLNPRRLGELYSALPGVIYAEPNGWGFAGFATFPIFPRLVGNNMTYVFTRGSAGPIWYFKYVDDEPYYVGTTYRCCDTLPNWLSEARINMENFTYWDGPP